MGIRIKQSKGAFCRIFIYGFAFLYLCSCQSLRQIEHSTQKDIGYVSIVSRKGKNIQSKQPVASGLRISSKDSSPEFYRAITGIVQEVFSKIDGYSPIQTLSQKEDYVFVFDPSVCERSNYYRQNVETTGPIPENELIPTLLKIVAYDPEIEEVCSGNFYYFFRKNTEAFSRTAVFISGKFNLPDINKMQVTVECEDEGVYCTVQNSHIFKTSQSTYGCVLDLGLQRSGIQIGGNLFCHMNTGRIPLTVVFTYEGRGIGSVVLEEPFVNTVSNLDIPACSVARTNMVQSACEFAEE